MSNGQGGPDERTTGRSDQSTTNRVDHRLEAVVRAELLIHVVEMIAKVCDEMSSSLATWAGVLPCANRLNSRAPAASEAPRAPDDAPYQRAG